MSLGQTIRDRREEFGLTLDEVSSKVGFSKPYLSTIETCKVNNPPGDELLKRLEKVLKFESGKLLRMAHFEGMPSDIRHEYESAEAENKKLRSMIQDVVKKKSTVARLKRQFAGGKAKGKKKAGTILSTGRPIPVINRVSAGYPTDFDDLDYPVGVADDYVRCPDLRDPNAFAVRTRATSWSSPPPQRSKTETTASSASPRRTRRPSKEYSSSANTKYDYSRETKNTRPQQLKQKE